MLVKGAPGVNRSKLSSSGCSPYLYLLICALTALLVKVIFVDAIGPRDFMNELTKYLVLKK